MSNVADYEWDTAPLELVEIGYEMYLNSLFEGMQDDDKDVETITGLTFCGCDTCCTRETFAFLVPRIIDLYKQGYIRHKEEASA